MRAFKALIVAFLLAVFVAPATAEPRQPVSGAAVADEIRDLIAQSASAGVAGERVASAQLRDLYAGFGNQVIWQLDPAAETRGRLLEAALAAASDHGLDGSDLHPTALARIGAPATARAVGERDLLLSDALLRLAAKLRRGAAAADTLEDWFISSDPFDPAAALTASLRSGTFAQFLASLAPPDAQYRRLIGALRLYREIDRSGGWQSVPEGGELKLDGRDPRTPALRRRLAAEGYLAASDGELASLTAAVRQFQLRHGLDPDARAGARTLAEVNVAARQRAGQIAANLERWRHLPRQLGERYIVVNVADASLDLIEGGSSTFHTRVIIGDVRHPTPAVNATVTAVTFNPPWNIPPSIATREMLPKLKRDPGYLAANNIVVLGRDGDPFGTQLDWRRMSARDFHYRLQQLPGPKNSLGGIKFEMSNRWNVYLHDTPVKALFERSQRGFSHGCVRVQQPAELARRLLDDAATWSAEAIAQAVADGQTRSVALRRTVPVYLLYWTAFVDADGAVNFRNDLYRRDPAIERALDLEPSSPRRLAPEACNGGTPVVSIGVGG